MAGFPRVEQPFSLSSPLFYCKAAESYSHSLIVYILQVYSVTGITVNIPVGVFGALTSFNQGFQDAPVQVDLQCSLNKNSQDALFSSGI